MVDLKFAILFLVATAAISSSIFFGLARPWESAGTETPAREASAPTPRPVSPATSCTGGRSLAEGIGRGRHYDLIVMAPC